ncbi:Uncharacterised protein [Mycobacteroides abscessus subsp. abscessus]|uniref:hypothetical protein n=1 Tax=Mycobacteroides abscessus TaxID=36809 RepID=UPI00092BF469|nr:hypothetical protein [Mycobacteroides abscessus]SHS91816.1 Uncharacterised protein [Mycobacteroides abscessus subsp. abscessus]SHT68092.1 Uncharacterised protein [Mycobacteroides abscessus subsp. abscessus]SHU21296.1 Uncharacterised protein [Mycobacteroides abscessus subsp. abscessus]SHX03275.1 Uncharacterised protein [Mycobacteroides abscessus subsp. abscessus]SIB03286.1 Uncharacterised protein [Mycobacteroides abscessus subsp. abscessus]
MSKRGDRRRKKEKAKTKTNQRPSGQSPFAKVPTELSGDPHETLIDLLNLLPRIYGSSPTKIGDGSRMADDRDAAGDLVNLPLLCQHYFSGSLEFLATLYSILPVRSGHVQIPRYSAYPLIRGVIEHSAQAAWILGASDRRERFVRLLQTQKSEMNYDRRYLESTSSANHLREDDTPETRSAVNRLQREAKASWDTKMTHLLKIANIFGIEKSEFDQGVRGGYEAIVYQAFYEAQRRNGVANTDNESHWTARYAASVWMFISGLTHPSVSRAWANARSAQPDGSLVAVETASNPIVVRDSLLVGLRLQAHVFMLWKLACTSP